VAIRLLLDEDVRPLLAETLRQRGFDARHVDELKRSGLSDAEQLARISHQPPAASADRAASQGRAPSGLLDILLSMPASASVRAALIYGPLRALATESGEKCGLVFAAKQRRAFLTHNIRDFVLLDREYRAKGATHYGILVCDQVPFRELLRRTLRCLDRESDADIRNRVLWLQDFK
jgi:hypothetical protein